MKDAKLWLIGADGSKHLLSCGAETYHLATKAGLFGLTPVAHASRTVANLPGTRLDSTRRLARKVPLPIWVRAETEQGVIERLGDLGRILSAGEGLRLVFERPDGSARELPCRYVDGADAAQLVPGSNTWAAKLPLVLEAHDPDWRSTTEDALVLAMQFSDARKSGMNRLSVHGRGDVDSWPEWTIEGPAENIHIVNLNTARMIRVVRVLRPGDTLRLRSGRNQGVWLNDVLDYTVLDPTASDLWPIVPGLNLIDVRAMGLTSGDIGRFRLRFLERFDTP